MTPHRQIMLDSDTVAGLAWAVAEVQAVACLEIGTYLATGSTVILGGLMAAAGGRLYCVDPFDCDIASLQKDASITGEHFSLVRKISRPCVSIPWPIWSGGGVWTRPRCSGIGPCVWSMWTGCTTKRRFGTIWPLGCRKSGRAGSFAGMTFSLKMAWCGPFPPSCRSIGRGAVFGGRSGLSPWD